VERRTADLKAANQKLENVIEERKRLENELLEIAENERRRIGFDLHDDLGQKLTGMALMMKGLERRLATERNACVDEAGRIHNLMQDIIHHTHNLARQFSSLDVKGDDLVTVLKGLAANVKKLFEITCAFTVKGALPALPNNVTLQLYKIAQEAVSNAIKHGKATQVSIGLLCDEAQLTMTIKNDGLPFVQPSGTSTRMGLRIMHYRANTIDAELEIKASGSTGTMVTCRLPIKSKAVRSLLVPSRKMRADRAEDMEAAAAGSTARP
jgi:signal transduction histidine kinase